MELSDLLLKIMLEARQYIIKEAKSGAVNEEKWANSWPEDCIEPPSTSDLLLSDVDTNASFKERLNKAWISTPSWYNFLLLYSHVLKSYKNRDYIEALNSSFVLQFQLGKEAGKLEEQRKSIQASADKRHQPARDAALNYYKRFSLDKLKAPAAASILEERAGTELKYDALYDYVLFYRKRIKLINASIPKFRESLLSALSADKDETGSIAQMVEQEVLRFQGEEIGALRFLPPKLSKLIKQSKSSKSSKD